MANIRDQSPQRLTFSDLPADCLLCVADNITELKDLSALAKTNHSLHALINPQLYRRGINTAGDRNPLRFGCWYRKVNTVRYSIEAGADVNATQDEMTSEPPLSWSLSSLTRELQSLGLFGLSIVPGEDLPQARQNGYDVIELLLNAGADPNFRGWNESMPLHQAAEVGDENIIRLLLARGADFRLYDRLGYTPLHTAAMRCGKELGAVKAFIDNGANVDTLAMNNRRTPLHCAASAGLTEVAKLLLDLGADVESRDQFRQTPLHCASIIWVTDTDKIPVLKLLVERGANLEAVDAQGLTPLQQAVVGAGDTKDIIDWLVDNGANSDVRDGNGRTLIELARSHGRTAVAERFQRRSERVASRGKKRVNEEPHGGRSHH